MIGIMKFAKINFRIICVILIITICYNCGPKPPKSKLDSKPFYLQPEPTKVKSDPEPVKPPAIFDYNLTIKVNDNAWHPIENVQVIIQRVDASTLILEDGAPDTLFTDTLGVIETQVTPKNENLYLANRIGILKRQFELLEMEWDDKDDDLDIDVLYGDKQNTYHFLANYTASKDGYYSYSSSKLEYEDYNKKLSLAINITLTRPTDYFNNTFNSTSNDDLKIRILGFLDLLRVQALIKSTKMKLFSINQIVFKEHTYLSMHFDHLIVYNSLKLDKYDIGKRIFDDVIRKFLSPLNDYIYSPRDFWGYDLVVEGNTRDFTNDSPQNTVIQYRFLIPAEIVRAYKNKDFTGQDLLDKSIILMDDERINLVLQ